MAFQWIWITAKVGRVKRWPWSRRVVRLSIEPEKPEAAEFILDEQYADERQAFVRIGFPVGAKPTPPKNIRYREGDVRAALKGFRPQEREDG